jgi:hypothetical protein
MNTTGRPFSRRGGAIESDEGAAVDEGVFSEDVDEVVAAAMG